MSNAPLTPDFQESEEKVSDCTSAQMQELNDVKEFLKIEHSKYTKLKILYDATRDCVFHSNLLKSDLKSKVEDILLGNSCAQVVDLDSEGFSQKSSVLLGLTSLKNSSELNYDESINLKKAVNLILQDKYKSICEGFSKITGENINTVLSQTQDFGNFSLSAEDQYLVELREKLEAQQKKYLNNLMQEQKILEDFVKLRISKLPEVCNEKIKECQIKSCISELQTKILKERTRIDIFMETSHSHRAYKEFIKDIKQQQTECENDIQHLQKLKEQYRHVACKQYDDLLKSFLQYKSSLEKKKQIYESLH